MNKLTRYASVFGLIFAVGMTGPVWADDDDDSDSDGQRWSGLGGQTFAIEGEYLYDPFGIGAPFVNCYTFNEDMTPEDALVSGVWDDPLFPVLGTWVQHTDHGKVIYTATADTGDGLTLVQNGTVKGKRRARLKAYSIVSLAPFGIIAEILSTGRAVDECPYDL
ncbi:MAG: hypothetical protein QNJ40_25480 [Xanthomonadales bacterium]|nr:hypothetical protein [Xanthomonadales bacterium]